jgi:magnesium-transporting ATPase (P-type)
MAHVHVPSELHARYLPRSARADALAGTLFAVGLVSFIVRLFQDPQSAWISYVSNWLFFTSISAGAVLLAVATWITKAKWNWSVRRVSQAMVAFLPIAFVLLLPMLTLREGYFPWIEMMASDPVVQKKAAYLNIPFLISRNVLGLALLFGMALYFVYLAVRPDMGLSDKSELDDEGRRSWRERLTQGWMGQEQEEVSSYKRMTTMAPALALVYALVMTIVAYDWAMSLAPHWYSTMFGPWFFMGAFWGGIAATILWSMYLRTKHKGLEHCVGLHVRHDLGKLAFAFTVFWTYLFFSQYIVIWYGKLPWEQAWIIRRSEPPWGGFSALVVVLCFVVPFAGLIGRKAKMKPALLSTFATVILLGLWLERYVLVAPSLYREGDPIFTIWHPLIGLMFLGLWMGSIRWFLSTFPAVQIWQPMSDPESLDAERTTQGVAGI